MAMSNSFPGLLRFLSREYRAPEGTVVQATKEVRTLSKAQ